MNKNILLTIASVVTLVTMGAGCAATVPNYEPGAATSTPMATMVIKELGITINIPQQYKDDVSYVVKQFTDGDSGVSLYSKSVAKKEKSCGPGSLGYITKSKKLFNIGTGEERNPIAGVDVKMGDSYITIEGPQDLCTGDKELQKEISDRTKALHLATKTIEGGESQKNDTGKEKIVNGPLSYSLGVRLPIVDTLGSAPFGYKTAELIGMAEECGSIHDAGYFEKLVKKFDGVNKKVYSFKADGTLAESTAYVVTLLPNRPGYNSLAQFKQDFDFCSSGGDMYPKMLNKDWLVFVSSCGSGYDDGSRKPHLCDTVQKEVEPTLKLSESK